MSQRGLSIERAARIRKTLTGYSGPGGIAEDEIKDALVDLLHWALAENLSPETLLSGALNNFDRERGVGGFVHVVFSWSEEKGHCVECGNPAAYNAPDMYGPESEGGLLCSPCAARANAVDGETIIYLFEED